MLDRVVVFARDMTVQLTAVTAALSGCVSDTLVAHSGTELINFVNRCSPDGVVLLCSHDRDGNCLQLTEQVRRIDHACPIVILTEEITIDFVMRALRAGVSDVVDLESFGEALARSLDHLASRRQTLPAHDCNIEGGHRMVGSGTAMRAVRDNVAKVAASDANVLITGESGTGKELAAELIHRNSRRRAKPFVSINCAAIPDALLESELFGYERGAFTGAQTSRDGKLQLAAGGTLFLDEIGDMTLSSQAKILRALETRVIQKLGSNVSTPIHLRLIAATNQDLERLTTEKKFRQDLYFRLNVVRIHLPPLRDRLEDIPELTNQILDDLSGRESYVRRIEGDVLRRLQMHDWPGNIRELRNVIQSILVFSAARSISIADVSLETRKRLRVVSPHSESERSKILSALSSADWNRGEAARILQCSRMTLYRKMAKYSITTRRG